MTLPHGKGATVEMLLGKAVHQLRPVPQASLEALSSPPWLMAPGLSTISPSLTLGSSCQKALGPRRRGLGGQGMLGTLPNEDMEGVVVQPLLCVCLQTAYLQIR